MVTLYQSRAVKVIEKPAGVLSTDISDLICHRLDRDTSGCLIIAKNHEIKRKIQEQFKKREVKKVYQALVLGEVSEKKVVVEGWLERDSKNSAKMRLNRTFLESGNEFSPVAGGRRGRRKRRYSKTIIRLKEVFRKKLFANPSSREFNLFSLVEAQPITGRKHQVRVHLNSLGHPILGDRIYGSKICRRASERLGINRLMLHAKSISFIDPDNQKNITVISKVPNSFEF